MATHDLTAERLREVLHYDPDTGVFTRRIKTGVSTKAGDVAGGLTNGYVLIRIDGKKRSAHRLAWLYMTGQWPPDELDHINGKKDDNRWSNLRHANRSLNSRNRGMRCDNSSGFRGVYAAKRSWNAQIRVGAKFLYLGTFKTAEAAASAYNAARATYFPEQPIARELLAKSP